MNPLERCQQELQALALASSPVFGFVPFEQVKDKVIRLCNTWNTVKVFSETRQNTLQTFLMTANPAFLDAFEKHTHTPFSQDDWATNAFETTQRLWNRETPGSGEDARTTLLTWAENKPWANALLCKAVEAQRTQGKQSLSKETNTFVTNTIESKPTSMTKDWGEMQPYNIRICKQNQEHGYY